MASDESSNGHEDGQRDDVDDLILPDAPLPTVEPTTDVEQEEEESSSDGMSFLNEPLPPLPLNSSDDDLYEPESPDEGEGFEDQDEVIKPEEDADDVVLHRTPSPWAPHKRQADEPGYNDRPFKKAKSTAFNHGYLTILNIDIEDAAAQYAPHEEEHLPASQIGMTNWTSVEKELFFEALSRLGKDDLPGIARRIRTKGELEVRQYLNLLRDTVSTKKRERKLMPTCPPDMPAAIEIGPQCSAALEEAADAVASRQETYEESLERKQWGDNWLITPFNYRRMEAAAPGDMPSLQLFRVSSWLRLPERVFMNANFPENNWQFVSDENPSIRATALEDFYSLAVSITKRLVAATIYVAQSRIRAKKDVHFKSEAKNLVWGKDVEAAALSIGLKTNSKRFWAGCARRLRLDVYDDNDHHDDDDDNDADAESDANSEAEQEPMTYDEVETALGSGRDGESFAQAAEDSEEDELVSLSDTPSLDELSDLDDQPAQQQPSYEPTSAQPPAIEEEDPELDINEEAVRTETKELLLYTAQDNPPTTRTRQAAEYRIRNELQHVAYADALDAKASQREERRLWEMLGREPPDESVRVKVTEKGPRRIWQSVDDMYPSTGEWRDSVKYVSEWERTLEDGNQGK
jgi:RNA polymerase I-specific transcription initiation factor RRN5